MPTATAEPPTDVSHDLLAVVHKYWGFESLRPLQEQAMRAVLDRRDSLLVLPTGGGKSLCYQAPAVLRGGTTVVISPLISLMKDQVDGLLACDVPAVQLNSTLSPSDAQAAERAVIEGKVRLVFASPERMATGSFRSLLKRAGVRTFAIDEAHCISHWGHDFRPEYRQLKELRQHFPEASIHGFTATATEQVRRDIVEQLGLRDAQVLVGNFDRPNLNYRVVARGDLFNQVLDTVHRHQGEAGIIYCVRRRDVDELTPLLKSAGVNAVPYHAGMDARERKATHDLFTAEKCDVVVATVAFGMGIDRSNIRYVLHTGMPKSIEHYQQEAGRAGRDGLEAECLLLYSPSDALTWKKIVQKSVAESEGPVDPGYLENVYRHLADMENYCRPSVCRHRALVEYFGQAFEPENCGACDLCLDEAELVPDGQTIARKILSCVYRVQEGFGASHVTAVLRGANTEAIRSRGHDKLSTHGLLSAYGQNEVRDWIGQLIGQGLLDQVGNEYPILKLNPRSWEVMNNRTTVSLRALTGVAAGAEGERRSRADADSWEGVDRELFEALREMRSKLAGERGLPPYVVFGDASLRDLARMRPSTLEAMHLAYGIGEAKVRDFGAAVMAILDEHCRARQLSRDNKRAAGAAPEPVGPRRLSAGATAALSLFRRGASIDDVAQELERARSTVCEYLCDFIRTDKPASIAPWVPDETYRLVEQTIARVGAGPLKPLFVALNEQVSYDMLKAVAIHLRIKQGSTTEKTQAGD